MMYVHVSPGNSPGAVTFHGEGRLLREVLADLLGRTSVAALTFVAGYLLFRSLRGRTVGEMIRKKAQVLLWPMLLWNAAFVVLLMAKSGFDERTAAKRDVLFGDPLAALNALSGLLGPTASVPLFFLRDLFVAAALVLILRRAIAVAPMTMIALAGAATLFDLLEPVVFRPSILLFLLLGWIACARGLPFDSLCAPRVAIAVTALSAAGLGALAAAATFWGADLGEPGREAADILRRAILTANVLWLAATLAQGRAGAWLASLEPAAFPTYLSHQVVIPALWLFWAGLVTDATHPAYLLFFVGAPVCAFVFGAAFERVLRMAPSSFGLFAIGRKPIGARGSDFRGRAPAALMR